MFLCNGTTATGLRVFGLPARSLRWRHSGSTDRSERDDRWHWTCGVSTGGPDLPTNPTYCEDPVMANVIGEWRAISLFPAPARWHRSTVPEFEVRAVCFWADGRRTQATGSRCGARGIKVFRRPARTFPPARGYHGRLALEWIEGCASNEAGNCCLE